MEMNNFASFAASMFTTKRHQQLDHITKNSIEGGEWPSSFANSKQKTHKETKASHENVLKESNGIRLSAHCLVSCCRFGPQFRRAMVVFVVPTLFFIHFYRCGFSMCLSLPFEKYVWILFYTLYSSIEIHRL